MPLDPHEAERRVGRDDREPIHVSIPGSADDPRTAHSIPGVVVHRVPPLHPDDVTTIDGIPVTSPSRTLIDCAEFMTAAELRAAFARAREIGLLDADALRASRARVEWRPSLAMLDEVIQEFCG
jgi:predicted transcriptional regulator of viral defense system